MQALISLTTPTANTSTSERNTSGPTRCEDRIAESVSTLDHQDLSPLAIASRNLIVRLSEGADPSDIEAGCRELLTQNTNGLGSVDTKVVEVASEIVRGVLSGVVILRSPAITAATRGVSESGLAGDAGNAERLSISVRTCRDVRDSDHASRSDYSSALEGAAPAAHMTPDELRERIELSTPKRHGNA